MVKSQFDAFKHCMNTLKKAGINNYRHESALIFDCLFDISQTELIVNPNTVFNGFERLNDALCKRTRGIPLQYILGEWEFYGYPIAVGEGVLIPRPETEVLVDLAIEHCIEKKQLKIADLCSGSGAIAIALANELSADIFAVEISSTAVNYIKKNIEINKVTDKVKIYNGDIFNDFIEDLPEFDCILSNPPYLSEYDMYNLQEEVKHEPSIALYGGNDGLEFYKSIFGRWTGKLKNGGLFAVEIGMGQAKFVMEIMSKYGYKPKTKKDFNNIDRVVYGYKS